MLLDAKINKICHINIQKKGSAITTIHTTTKKRTHPCDQRCRSENGVVWLCWLEQDNSYHVSVSRDSQCEMVNSIRHENREVWTQCCTAGSGNFSLKLRAGGKNGGKGTVWGLQKVKDLKGTKKNR